MHVTFQWLLALQISILFHALKMQTLAASFALLSHVVQLNPRHCFFHLATFSVKVINSIYSQCNDWSKFDVNIQIGRLQVRLLLQGGLHLRSSYPKYTFEGPLIESAIAIKMDRSPFPSDSEITVSL